jgi:hypothetical protein
MSLNKIDQDIKDLLKQLPEALKFEVFQYTEYLVSKYGNQNDLADNSLDTHNSNSNEAKQNEEKYGYGSLVGKIEISDDFDEPLEEFAEYM